VSKLYRDGRHYRERARECRVVAEILATVELREKMLRIAADYERMADAADKMTNDSMDVADLKTLR
jgi:hypothetical protein